MPTELVDGIKIGHNNESDRMRCFLLRCDEVGVMETRDHVAYLNNLG